MKRKMRHLVFTNEIHVWVKSIYQSEYNFLKQKGFTDQMKSLKDHYDSPTRARERVAEIAQERIRNLKFQIKLMEDVLRENAVKNGE